MEQGVPDYHDYIFTGESDEAVIIFLIFSLESLQETFMPELESKSTSCSKEEEPILLSSRKSVSWKLWQESPWKFNILMGRIISLPLLQEKSWAMQNLKPSKTLVCHSTRTACHMATCSLSSWLTSHLRDQSPLKRPKS